MRIQNSVLPFKERLNASNYLSQKLITGSRPGNPGKEPVEVDGLRGKYLGIPKLLGSPKIRLVSIAERRSGHWQYAVNPIQTLNPWITT